MLNTKLMVEMKFHIKHTRSMPVTFDEFKQTINSLLGFSASNALSKNRALANECFKIKSTRTITKLTV